MVPGYKFSKYTSVGVLDDEGVELDGVDDGVLDDVGED
jgi:hypothetical protein